MVFIEMENRQKYITLMFKLVLKMSHLHLAILAFSPIFGHLKLTYMVTLFLIFTHHTLFENCLKSRISILSFLDFPPIFVKSDMSGNTFRPLTSGYQNRTFLAFLMNFCLLKM